MTTYLTSLAGGLLIGTSAAALLLFLGRIAGVSGITAGIFRGGDRDERPWRACFVGGLLAGGALLHVVDPSRVAFDLDRSGATIALAGLLVGVGTQLGNGCTSGHGVCGVGRGSRRSIAATMIFMAVGMATVFVTRLVWGTT